MPVQLSEHGKQQLRRRGIPQKTVIEAVYENDEIVSSLRGRKLRRKKIGARILEVVTITEGPRITVITAYFLKE